ncbi:membrane protein, partial [sediment metagenome]
MGITSEDMIANHNGSTAAILAMVAIKMVIIYKSINYLTGLGTKFCEDGEALGANIANAFGGVAKFAAGGALLKLGGIYGGNVLRGVVGRTGQLIGEKTTGLHDSSSSFARYTGRLGQRAENFLYGGLKIGGKSFQDEVNNSTQEDANIDARLTPEQRKKRFYERMGGNSIKYNDGHNEKINKIVTEGRQQLSDEALEYMKKTGASQFGLDMLRTKFVEKIEKQYGKGSYEGNKEVVV